MVLSDSEIIFRVNRTKRYGEDGNHPIDQHDGLDIDPFDGENVQPASYDLTLGTEFEREREPGRKRQSIENGAADRRHIETDKIEIQPGEFLLGHTQERVTLPNTITAEVRGRSSIGRLGLIPHTAGWVDPGFSGDITLEFVNHSEYPIVLECGQRIAQIVFREVNGTVLEPYGEKEDSKYQGQTGVTGSRIEQDE
jgi:dCTP deaminase